MYNNNYFIKAYLCFCPRGIFLASAGALQNLSLNETSITCLHMYFLRKTGQSHLPSAHLEESFGKSMDQTLDAFILN